MPRESVSDLVEQGISRTRGDERSLSELARRQHGVVGRAQLLARGWTKEEIDWRIRVGRLHRVHDGVYSVGHRLLIRQGQWTAAVLASGPDALLSYHTAAALWGIRGYSGGAVHVTVPHKSSSTKRIRRHFSLVPPDERAVEEGIPVTSVHRTIFRANKAPKGSCRPGAPEGRASRSQTLEARGPLRPLPSQAPPALTPLQRPDLPRRQELRSRLPLAGHASDRRARRLAGSRHPLGLP